MSLNYSYPWGIDYFNNVFFLKMCCIEEHNDYTKNCENV